MSSRNFVWFSLVIFVSVAPSQIQAADDLTNGVCHFPDSLALSTNILSLYNPLRKYYVPRASAAYYSAIYEIINGGRSPANRTELTTLQPRAQFLTLRALRRLGVLDVTFDGPGLTDTWFAYRCLPSGIRAPLLNTTCMIAGGNSRVGIETPEQAGRLQFSVIWSDAKAANLWGCFNGEQSFHIISTEPELTVEQIATNDALLEGLGFNITSKNVINMKYLK